MQLEEAINILKPFAKYSCIPGQKHIDLSIAPVDKLALCEEALRLVNEAIRKGEMSRDQLLERLLIK